MDMEGDEAIKSVIRKMADMERELEAEMLQIQMRMTLRIAE